MPTHDFTLHALDGRPLAATLHTPDDAIRAAVVVLGALGVPRRYYLAFAAWLAERVLEDRLPVRVQLQLHKVLWGPDRQGV